jgi:hypothetical protein
MSCPWKRNLNQYAPLVDAHRLLSSRCAITGFGQITAHVGIQQNDTSAKVSSLKTPALHLETKKGNRYAQAGRQFLERPAELGAFGFVLLIHDHTH